MSPGRGAASGGVRGWPHPSFADGGHPYAGFGTVNGGTPNAQHHCNWCGYRWPIAKAYLWWPMRLRWGQRRSSSWFNWHGWEVGGLDRLWRRRFGWTFHLGRLKVMFGPDWRKRDRSRTWKIGCPRCRVAAWEFVS